LPVWTVLLSRVNISTTCAGSSIASGCRKTALITVKIAVLAPIPSASESTATVVNPGFFTSTRVA
jgi:hypothetical protein